MLIDRFGRRITTLRVSVTDRCNFQCLYCMPQKASFYPHSEILTFEEIIFIVKIFLELGVTKVRLTGGEPLVRKGIEELVGELASLPGVNLHLTTNGFFLEEKAECLKKAGIQGINISLDTFNPHKFQKLTGFNGLAKVLQGIEWAKTVGFSSLKINTVVIKGYNDEEIFSFVDFAQKQKLRVRFIEFMPLNGGDFNGEVISGTEILKLIATKYTLKAKEDNLDSKEKMLQVDGGGEVGIITSMSRPFCDQCNRLRLTCDGKLRTCLFAGQEYDLKSILRNGARESNLVDFIKKVVLLKAPGRENFSSSRFMYAIGG